ncbi:MAG: YceI family protein [Bacteroidetes bacterium]|nr:YceI family protein [Bacteroidota bacterium]MBS1541684.1 YceI family protein [Bacteroidota bacterium]
MKKINLLVAAILVAGVAAAQGTWTADKPHSRIGFNVTHLVVSEVEGAFKDFDVKVTSTTADFNGADVEFTAKTASINTENEKRDGHLKSDDFFNAEKYPEIKFKGKLVKNGNNYELKGDFTIRDVTKQVAFEVTYGGSIKAFGGEKAGFKLKGKINRFDYNLKWDKTTGADLIVGKEVEIVCKVELNKQA